MTHCHPFPAHAAAWPAAAVITVMHGPEGRSVRETQPMKYDWKI